jgi:uncharacterized protein YndB with AHSA1/START domain
MSERSSEHATFVIDRTFSAPAERVFAAWSDAETKRRWNACHDDWKTVEHRLDFRVGGVETNDVVRPDGVVHAFRARFHDIVPCERIVYAYDMHVGDALVSVSLVTVTFTRTSAKRTKMTFTEQVVFVDGHGDVEERREGTEVGLARITDELARHTTTR